MADSGPQLVEKVLRQTDIHAGDEHVGAEGFQLADAGAELFLILLIGHRFTG